jgi:hypothetical protein
VCHFLISTLYVGQSLSTRVRKDASDERLGVYIYAIALLCCPFVAELDRPGRERKRHGLPPLDDQQLAAAAADYTVHTVENPAVLLSLDVSFAYLRHAMIKIAYELAFLWFGEDYLTDPLAVELRAAICNPDIASTDQVASSIGFAGEGVAFSKFWVPNEKHHLAYANTAADKAIVICVRIFDIYEAIVVVSREPSRYITNSTGRERLRFLAIDAIGRRTIDTTFDQEVLRLGRAMSMQRRLPPFTDPLMPLAA